MAGRARTALQPGSGHRLRMVGDRRRRDIGRTAFRQSVRRHAEAGRRRLEPVPPGRHPERHLPYRHGIPDGHAARRRGIRRRRDDRHPEVSATTSAEIYGRRPHRQLHRQRAPAQYPDLVERGPYPDPGGRRRLGRPAPDGQDDFRGHVRIHPPRIRRYVGL